MKKLSTYLFLLFFSFQAPSWADDISDFQIEGMSIGDSLLDYYSETEIKNWHKTYYEKSKKFIKIDTPRLSGKMYDVYAFHIKDNDSKYIIYDISGGKYFGRNNVKDCKNFKDKVVKDLILVFKNIKPNSYEYIYDTIEDGKSIAHITDFDFSSGSIRVWCVDWSKVTEENTNWEDNVSVNISSMEFLDWLNNESR